jgi:adenylyltransferase/sulfurtransferase
VESNGIPEITVTELKKKIDGKEKFVLVDVREPNEFEIGRIPGSKLIPLGEVAARANELDTADDIVLHCKMGGRSAKALNVLKSLGFKKLKNLKGGITAWSDQIDPSVPKY